MQACVNNAGEQKKHARLKKCARKNYFARASVSPHAYTFTRARVKTYARTKRIPARKNCARASKPHAV